MGSKFVNSLFMFVEALPRNRGFNIFELFHEEFVGIVYLIIGLLALEEVQALGGAIGRTRSSKLRGLS